ncbi:hypothetical protein FA13DRAFT_1719020 [Coprinellus micaceus]|uniref:Uncharacterized protein n=1 Tax=Coprinellus micaceus TaxID=71717 RepID=A0A4Y7SCF8_COPMI|nr:hypothetical protein FA13DRAFT_1719020 [Coprinellus micaceus]
MPTFKASQPREGRSEVAEPENNSHGTARASDESDDRSTIRVIPPVASGWLFHKLQDWITTYDSPPLLPSTISSVKIIVQLHSITENICIPFLDRHADKLGEACDLGADALALLLVSLYDEGAVAVRGRPAPHPIILAGVMSMVVYGRDYERRSTLRTQRPPSDPPVHEIWRTVRKPRKRWGSAVDRALGALSGQSYTEVLGQMVQDSLALAHGMRKMSSKSGSAFTSSTTSPWFSPPFSSPPSGSATPAEELVSSPGSASLVCPTTLNSGCANFVAGNTAPVVNILPNAAPIVNIVTHSAPVVHSGGTNTSSQPVVGPVVNATSVGHAEGVHCPAPTTNYNAGVFVRASTAVDGNTLYPNHGTARLLSSPPISEGSDTNDGANGSVAVADGDNQGGMHGQVSNNGEGGEGDGGAVAMSPGDATKRGFKIQRDGNVWFRSCPQHADELHEDLFWKKTIANSLPGNTRNASAQSVRGLDIHVVGHVTQRLDPFDASDASLIGNRRLPLPHLDFVPNPIYSPNSSSLGLCNQIIGGPQWRDGHGDGGYDCLCLGCHHLSETEEIFKNVATVIGVYKVADYRQKKLASDSHATPEQKRQAKRSLEEAVEALRDVVDDIDTLPPASKQQLVVLFQDMKSSGLPHALTNPSSFSSPTLNMLALPRLEALVFTLHRAPVRGSSRFQFPLWEVDGPLFIFIHVPSGCPDHHGDIGFPTLLVYLIPSFSTSPFSTETVYQFEEVGAYYRDYDYQLREKTPLTRRPSPPDVVPDVDSLNPVPRRRPGRGGLSGSSVQASRPKGPGACLGEDPQPVSSTLTREGCYAADEAPCGRDEKVPIRRGVQTFVGHIHLHDMQIFVKTSPGPYSTRRADLRRAHPSPRHADLRQDFTRSLFDTACRASSGTSISTTCRSSSRLHPVPIRHGVQSFVGHIHLHDMQIFVKTSPGPYSTRRADLRRAHPSSRHADLRQDFTRSLFDAACRPSSGTSISTTCRSSSRLHQVPIRHGVQTFVGHIHLHDMQIFVKTSPGPYSTRRADLRRAHPSSRHADLRQDFTRSLFDAACRPSSGTSIFTTCRSSSRLHQVPIRHGVQIFVKALQGRYSASSIPTAHRS